jgi:4-hydroxy-3-methylbut-2-enyl diphosphate reductase
MKVDIDKNSGYCFGVIRAIEIAEKELQNSKILFCIGDIVHNEMEVKRLEEKGLKIITYDEFKKLRNVKVLIRAHGEPPETYKIALENNISLIDATCPIVLNLQKKIKKSYEEIKENKGQIVIFGKHGHAEVVGLLGQTDNSAIVVDNETEISKIDFSKPIRLYSQTTKSIDEFKKIVTIINDRTKLSQSIDNNFFISHDTICRQVSNRSKELIEFSKKYDVIIFVSGQKSSNGQYLFNLCKSVNEKTYRIINAEDLNIEWIKNAESIGVCGATSTPMWLMENIVNFIKEL